MPRRLRTILTCSGKGGTGKTTVTVSLAYALKDLGFKVGLMDLDIHGPNIPKALGMDAELGEDLDGRMIIPADHEGLKVMSMGLYFPTGMIALQGIEKQDLVEQCLGSVDWSGTNMLIADLPPGTGDEVMAAIKYLKPDGTVVVTTPSDMALETYERMLDLLKFYHLKVGLTVMNMAGYVCPNCGHEEKIFGDPPHGSYMVPLSSQIARERRIPNFSEAAGEMLKNLKIRKPSKPKSSKPSKPSKPGKPNTEKTEKTVKTVKTDKIEKTEG